jgi:hypothetical protein
MEASTGRTGDRASVNAIDALRALGDRGFGSCEVRDQHGLTALGFRHKWDGVSDVVLVHAQNDAEAYRADDSFGQPEFPTSAVAHREAVGTVVEVVAAVLDWPEPDTAAVGPPGSAHASDVRACASAC